MELWHVTGRWLDKWSQYVDANSDPDTRQWFLIDSFTPVCVIIVSYLAVCVYVGPWFMRHRQPFTLTNTLVLYNLVNVAASVWLVNECLQSGWLYDYNVRCQPIDYSGSPNAKRMRRTSWVYFMCKLMELSETVFFVLRKKDRQVSHLHLYHHTLMPALAWIGVRFAPDGQATLGMLLNCVVHAVMYSYYLLAALGPSFSKYLWWKKYLTALQLVQFVIVVVHLSQLFIVECDYPKMYALFVGVNVAYIFYLFALFYRQSYLRRRNKDKTL